MMREVRFPSGGPWAGFTFVEVLVAAAVVAVALLGGAVALLAAIRGQRDAQYRTQAALLASDLAEMIAANPGAGTEYALAAGETPAEPGTDCQVALPCAPADLAREDLYGWYAAVVRALPEPLAEVEVTQGAEGTASRYAITLRWAAAAADPARLERTVHR